MGTDFSNCHCLMVFSSTMTSSSSLMMVLSLFMPDLTLSLRCYSDHSGPNSAGGVEVCDEGGVCSSSRIVFREEGVLRTAMSRHCVYSSHCRGGGVLPVSSNVKHSVEETDGK